jgi:hypothetical protein
MTLNVGTVTFQIPKFHAQDPEVSVERVERRRHQAVGPDSNTASVYSLPDRDVVYDGRVIDIFEVQPCSGQSSTQIHDSDRRHHLASGRTRTFHTLRAARFRAVYVAKEPLSTSTTDTFVRFDYGVIRRGTGFGLTEDIPFDRMIPGVVIDVVGCETSRMSQAPTTPHGSSIPSILRRRESQTVFSSNVGPSIADRRQSVALCLDGR